MSDSLRSIEEEDKVGLREQIRFVGDAENEGDGAYVFVYVQDKRERVG